MDWTLREGYSWAEDKEHCEEYGYFFLSFFFILKYFYRSNVTSRCF